MTNKEFQNILAQYPDDYDIWVDWSFGWEVPSNKYKEDPYMYINSDFGFIEIEPKEYRDIWIKCSERMPEEKLYEEDTLQGHRKWTESEQVLVCTSNNTYHTEWTHNGHWSSSQFKGIGGDSYEIVAWMPIPKFEEE